MENLLNILQSIYLTLNYYTSILCNILNPGINIPSLNGNTLTSFRNIYYLDYSSVNNTFLLHISGKPLIKGGGIMQNLLFSLLTSMVLFDLFLFQYKQLPYAYN